MSLRQHADAGEKQRERGVTRRLGENHTVSGVLLTHPVGWFTTQAITRSGVVTGGCQMSPTSVSLALERLFSGWGTMYESKIRTFGRSHDEFRYRDKLKFCVWAAFGFMWDAHNSLVGENPDSSNSLSHAQTFSFITQHVIKSET